MFTQETHQDGPGLWFACEAVLPMGVDLNGFQYLLRSSGSVALADHVMGVHVECGGSVLVNLVKTKKLLEYLGCTIALIKEKFILALLRP